MSLRVDGVTVRYGGVTAVDAVSLTVEPGEILGIIGPNGSGKTSLFDAISGFVDVAAGSVVLGRRDVTTLRPHHRSRLGLGRSFQDARLFSSLTVEESIAAALGRKIRHGNVISQAFGMPWVTDARNATALRVAEALDAMNLGAYAEKRIAELSTGTRRVVDLACMLVWQPKVILFDEPSTGIAQREAEALGPLLRRIRDETGAALLVIEHDLPLVSSVSDRVLAMDLGRVVTVGAASTVVRHPDVVRAYLGGDSVAVRRSGPR